MKAVKTRVLWVLMMALLLSACTTNSVLIGYFYGRMDNKMQERILDYASFSQSQELEIERSVDTFFQWHRSTELPKYAAYLSQIRDEIAADDYGKASILNHLQRIREMGQESFNRSPIAQAAPFLKSLSDDQISEIADHMKQKDNDFNKWYEGRKKADVYSERTQKIVKNVGRLGIKLNDAQSKMIQSGLENYRGGAIERFNVWNQWEERLLTLLQNRSKNNFEQEVSQHLAQYQNQMQLYSPENHAHNQRNTANVINELLLSLTNKQKTKLLKKLDQTEDSLISIANR